MPIASSSFYIPDMIKLSKWPWPAVLSPYYDTVRQASQEWMESYHLLPSEALDAFNRCDLAMIMAYTYCSVTEEHLRLGADLCQWYFLYDELSDVMDYSATRRLSDTLLLAIRKTHEPLPQGSHKLGLLTQELWGRVLDFSVPSSVLRLRQSLEEYIEGVCVEASDRDELHVRGITEYLKIRRASAASRSILHIAALHVDIPDFVMQDPNVESLTLKGMDLICIHNDIYSYNFERKHGIHGHNLITAIIKEKRLDIQGAIDYAGGMFVQTATDFIRDLNQIPRFGSEIDKALEVHLKVLCAWPIGLEEWTFRTERYFGNQRDEIRKTRTVELAPEPVGRQYDLQMEHLDTPNTPSQFAVWSKLVPVTGLASLSRFVVPVLIYHCFIFFVFFLKVWST